jgi:hypothetical protein
MKDIKAEFDKLQVKREFKDHIFYSSSPRLKLKLDSGFTLIGKMSEEKISEKTLNEDPMEKAMESASYIFGQNGEDGKINRGVVIRIYYLMGNPDQIVPDMFPEDLRTLEEGTMKILEDKYEYVTLACNNLFLKRERNLISPQTASGCFLAKGLDGRVGFGNKSRLQIIYFELLPQDMPCGAWNNADNLSEQQKTLLGNFIESSYSSIRFMKKERIIDTTSKYVDREELEKGEATSKYVDSPEENFPVVTDKSSEIEEKLRTLKKLLEKDLITVEEYEKKKADILDKL